MTANLPSTIGPVQFSADSVRLWCSDARKFDAPVAAVAPTPAEPPKPAPQLPIALIPDTSFVPQEYRLHTHSQRCLCCGSIHEWTAAYAFNDLSPRYNMGKRISHLVPVDRFSYNVPVRCFSVPQTTIPACFYCVNSIDLSHLEKPANSAAYQAILAAHQSAPEAPKAAPKPAKRTPTIHDLL
jgi:hypothetical protein